MSDKESDGRRSMNLTDWHIKAIEEGIADVEAGRTIPHERVREWLESWGTEDELDPPEVE